MKAYRADLHIHTLLSPCGSLEMSPARIIEHALAKELDIIGITDHNSTLHAKLTRQLGRKAGITVLCGVEVTTKEEVHCLAYFEDDSELNAFQSYLESKLPPIENDPGRFGDQVVIDKDENIIAEIPYFLLSGIQASLKQLEQKVHELDGIFIPAHIDRPYFSLLSQLGFIPGDIEYDAMELSAIGNIAEFKLAHPETGNIKILKNSDAHHLKDIGKSYSTIWMNSPNFKELRMALKGINGRYIEAA